MNFKKIITLLLAFTLTLSLAACGSKGDGKGDGDAQGATAEESYAQIQELADKENAIMEENLELWQKLFAAMNDGQKCDTDHPQQQLRRFPYGCRG